MGPPFDFGSQTSDFGSTAVAIADASVLAIHVETDRRLRARRSAELEAADEGVSTRRGGSRWDEDHRARHETFTLWPLRSDRSDCAGCTSRPRRTRRANGPGRTLWSDRSRGSLFTLRPLRTRRTLLPLRSSHALRTGFTLRALNTGRTLRTLFSLKTR